MSSTLCRRFVAGWIGAAVWLSLLLIPAWADGPATSGAAAPEALKPAEGAANPSGSPGASDDAKSPTSLSLSGPIPDPLPQGSDTPVRPASREPRSMLQLLPEERSAEPRSAEPRSVEPPSPAQTPPEKSLRPIPEEPASSAAEIETASFNGVTPGVSTLEDVNKSWGTPKEMRKHQGAMVHLYSVEPFDQVEVFLYEGKVASIVIRMGQAFPADAVAKQLALSGLKPVLVSNELGEILGQSYPERGVLFSFEPSKTAGKPSGKVAQIILEPVTSEPFVLRAETNLDRQTEASLKDLDHAIKLAPQNGRAHWLRARALVLLGDVEKAAGAVEESTRLEPNNGQYRLTYAQILSQLGRFSEAVAQAEKAVAASSQRPHIKARALCLLGDLMNSGPSQDYKRAMQYHHEAIKTAEPLLSDPHPAIRLPAKEVLVDAHLGAAHDVAWGNWNNKETAVPAWLKRASDFADDAIRNDGHSEELRFRVATRALAACVGLQGKLDPAPWAEQTLRVGQQLVAQSTNPPQKQQFQRELGLALYDAVQVCQMRNQREAALKHGQQAIEYLQAASAAKDQPADDYLLGRLYFRMGALRAAGEKNHRAAVEWFDKALPVLRRAAARVAPLERGRLGETMVSMGVSYWETGQRDQSVQVTLQGVELMERAVQEGSLPKAALDVPYSNLATMYRQLGQDDKARFYAEKARAKPETVRR